MGEAEARADRVVYTIGHSSHPPETFLGLLEGHGVQVVADVRSAPYSRYAPQYNREPLRETVSGRGLRYVYLGEELGGRPDGDAYYDDAGHALYDRIAASAVFGGGLERLERGIERYRVALLCSEENPEGCHRRLLVGRVLGERGVAVLHIRGDGGIEPEAGFAPEGGQLALWGDGGTAWRSTRSVSRGGARRSSSAP